MEKEKDIDQFIKILMSNVEDFSLDSKTFTQQVMAKVFATQHAVSRKKEFRQQLILSIAGLFTFMAILVILYQNGIFDGILISLNEFITPLTERLPIQSMKYIVVIVPLYFVVVRAVFSLFIFKRTSAPIQQFQINKKSGLA